MMENELFYQHVVEEIFGDSLPSDGCGEMLLGVFSQGDRDPAGETQGTLNAAVLIKKKMQCHRCF